MLASTTRSLSAWHSITGDQNLRQLPKEVMIRCLPLNDRGNQYDRSCSSAKWQLSCSRIEAEGFYVALDENANLPSIEFAVLRFVVQKEEEELVYHNIEVGAVTGIYRHHATILYHP